MGKTPAGIMIRTLTAADLTAVSSIDEKSFFDVWSPSMWPVSFTHLTLPTNREV